MKLSEFQKKWDEMCERLIAAGKMLPKEELENSVEENTSADKQVAMSAIFMPLRINGEELKKKWRAYRRKQAEENNNDSE